MNKAFFQFLVLVMVFLLTWSGLSRVDFMKGLHLEGISEKTEKKIGDMIMKSLEKNNHEIKGDSVVRVLDKIKNTICAANSFDPEDIKIHLISSDVVNAYTLPGHHIIVYTGLIGKCDSVTELCGVIAHEMGHIKLNHVMKRLGSEIGISVLTSVATNGNSQVAAEVLQKLSSSAFERKQESDADQAGVKYLQKAQINPQGFADMLLKMSEIQAGMPKQMEWISSHPDSKKRAQAIQSLIDAHPGAYIPVLAPGEWEVLKDAGVH